MPLPCRPDGTTGARAEPRRRLMPARHGEPGAVGLPGAARPPALDPRCPPLPRDERRRLLDRALRAPRAVAPGGAPARRAVGVMGLPGGRLRRAAGLHARVLRLGPGWGRGCHGEGSPSWVPSASSAVLPLTTLTRTWPSPSGVVPTRASASPGGASRRADSPMRSRAPGARRTGRVPRRAPDRVEPFVEPRSATAIRPSAATVTAQCSRETSGSSSGTSASAERPMVIWPPCRRWTPPASGPATTCNWVAASSASGCGSGSAGVPRASTAPSINGGSPRVHRWVSRRWAPAYSTTAPPLSRPGPRSGTDEPPSPATTDARAEATAASAVPAGAVTSTSQLAARAHGSEGGPSGSTTVSRICIAVSGPFCTGTCSGGRSHATGPTTADFPHRTRARRPVLEASSHLPPTTRPPPTDK